MPPKRSVSLLIFDNVEVLDFAGPFEVFSKTNKMNDSALFNIQTVSPNGQSISARNGLQVVPDTSMAKISSTDILIVPGGNGTRALLGDDTVLSWIQQLSMQAELVLSICTGALLFGKIGLLDDLQATTHHSAFDLLEKLAPKTEVIRDQRFIDNGKIITAAGISAGIDMSLYVIQRLCGAKTAQRTARQMEYPFND